MKISILFQVDGTKTIETTGFTGSSCQKSTQFLEQEFGPGSTKLKAEFFQKAQVNQAQQYQQS
jgi:hypothetical protein